MASEVALFDLLSAGANKFKIYKYFKRENIMVS